MNTGLRVTLLLNIPPAPSSYGYHAPISLLYLGAQLDADGHAPVVLDRRTFPAEGDYLEAICRSTPDLIGIALYADTYTDTYRLICKIRRRLPSAKLVLGGPEVSAARERMMYTFHDKIDYLLSGEAEYTLSRLARCSADSDQAALASIAGVSRASTPNC